MYEMMDTGNNKGSVGRCVNPKLRIRQHFSDLRKGIGYKKLQKDFNEYGEDAFEFEIIETHLVKEFDPREREDFYINKFDSIINGYNSSPGVRKGSFSMTTNVSEEMYELIKKISSEENKSSSAWIKEAIVEKLERDDKR